MYEKFVCEVDAHDNNIPIADGPTNYVSCTSLPKRVSYLVPRWTETNPDYDSAFDKAMTLVGDEFKFMVNHYGKDWWPARKVVEKAVEERFDVHGSGRVINLPSTGGGRLDWKSHIFSVEKSKKIDFKNNILFVIYEDQNKVWNITCVPKNGQKSLRCGLPSAWRGLPEAKLKDKSGIKGIRFVHSGGFKGQAETKEEVLKMVDKSLESDQVIHIIEYMFKCLNFMEEGPGHVLSKVGEKIMRMG